MDRKLIFPKESVICGICYDILETPYECNYCHNLFCELCLNEYITTKDKFRRTYFCPICRSNTNNFNKNCKLDTILEKYKNSNEKLCIKCNSVMPKIKYKNHIYTCWFKCTFCHQLFYNENKFLEHFSINGNNELNKVINKLNKKNNSVKEGDKIDDKSQVKRERFENNLGTTNGNQLTLIDRKGYDNKYDLYFCGKLNNIDCKCCEDKFCSPEGELCKECMKKNLNYHFLKGYYLINKKGKACKYSNGSFHCHSKFDLISQDEGGNFFKVKKTCKCNYTCIPCKNITKLMNYYLSTNTIKQLLERDLKNKEK